MLTVCFRNATWRLESGRPHSVIQKLKVTRDMSTNYPVTLLGCPQQNGSSALCEFSFTAVYCGMYPGAITNEIGQVHWLHGDMSVMGHGTKVSIDLVVFLRYRSGTEAESWHPKTQPLCCTIPIISQFNAQNSVRLIGYLSATGLRTKPAESTRFEHNRLAKDLETGTLRADTVYC